MAGHPLSVGKAGGRGLLRLPARGALHPGLPGLQRLQLSPSSAGGGVPKETAPAWSRGLLGLYKPTQPRCRSHCPWFCKAVPGTVVYGKDERRELWPGCGHLGLLSSSYPRSASLHAGEALALMLGVIWAPRHQGRLWGCGDGGRSNSCRK